MKKFKLSEYDNLTTLQNYIDRLSLLALTIFEWEGLPDSIDERYLEKTLLYHGKILFFNDLMLGEPLALKCFGSGMLNHYDLPISYTTSATNHSETYDVKDCVLMRDNYLEIPCYDTIVQFAYRLANAERTIDVNIHAQKTPVLILTKEKQKQTMLNVYAKYDGFEPVIFGNKDTLDPSDIQVLKTEAPFVADKLQAYKHQIWNEALTYIGIDNSNTDKKERLITSEVDSNSDNVDLSAQTRLMPRLQACKLINEKLGLNISVKVRDLTLNSNGVNVTTTEVVM